MSEMRRFCADSPYGKENCPYAKVMQETGEFPVTIASEEMANDGKKEYKTIQRMDTTRWVVYCTHPNREEKAVGIVEPYGGYCDVPKDCPEVTATKETIWEKLKTVIKALFK